VEVNFYLNFDIWLLSAHVSNILDLVETEASHGEGDEGNKEVCQGIS
jgi:hypothetical protein